MKKAVIYIVFLLAFTAIFSVYSFSAEEVTLVSSSGSVTEAYLGETVTVSIGIEGDYSVNWYCGENIIDGTDSITVGTDMLGKSITAHLVTDTAEYVSNAIFVPAQVPTLVMNTESGDYSIAVFWTAESNGSLITGYELSVTYSYSPETVYRTVSLPPETNSYVFENLVGNTEYTVKLIAVNSEGSTSATDTATPHDPDAEAAEAAKNEIESRRITIHMSLANDNKGIETYLNEYFNGYSEYGVTLGEITVTSFEPATVKTAQNPVGSAGSFKYIIEITKGDVRVTTKILSGTIDNTTSIVFITSDLNNLETGQTVKLTANTVDIISAEYKWYISKDNRNPGEAVQGEASSVLSFTPVEEGDYFISCVCGKITSDVYKITVYRPFIPVNNITCSASAVDVGIQKAVIGTVFPSNSTERTVIWSVIDDGGCVVNLNGRTVVTEKPGVFILRATVKNGIKSGEDYSKDFTFTSVGTVETAPVETTGENMSEYVSVINVSSLDGIQKAEAVLYGNGELQFTALSSDSLRLLLSEKNTDSKNVNIIAGIRFVYISEVTTDEVVLTLPSKYAGKTVIIVIRNETGNISSVVKNVSSRGEITLNAYMPDAAVIYITENDTGSLEYLSLFAVLVPVIAAAGFIGYYLYQKKKGITK